MKDEINSILHKSAAIFRNSGFGHTGFADVLLSIIMWKYVSDQADKRLLPVQDKTQWITPGREYHFNAVIANIADRDIKHDFERASLQWEKINRELSGLLIIDTDRLEYIPQKTWDELCYLWYNFFETFDAAELWQPDNTALLMDSMEEYLAEQYPDAHQYFTPHDIASLMAELLTNAKAESLYDPYCRSGNMLSLAAQNMAGIKKIEGDAREHITLKIARMRMVMLGLSGKSSIQRNVEDELPEKLSKFDVVIANPPFGASGRSMLSRPGGKWANLFNKVNRQEVQFICHILDHLSDTGRAAIIVPAIILSGKGSLRDLRKELIRENLVEGVITLPRVFYRTGVSTAILILNKSREASGVTIIDATAIGIRQRDRMRLRDEEITQLVQMFCPGTKKELPAGTVPGIEYMVASQSDLADNDFDLQLSTYKNRGMSFFRKEVTSSQLRKECIEMEEELKRVQEQINALIARDQL